MLNTSSLPMNIYIKTNCIFEIRERQSTKEYCRSAPADPAFKVETAFLSLLLSPSLNVMEWDQVPSLWVCDGGWVTSPLCVLFSPSVTWASEDKIMSVCGAAWIWSW